VVKSNKIMKCLLFTILIFSSFWGYGQRKVSKVQFTSDSKRIIIVEAYSLDIFNIDSPKKSVSFNGSDSKITDISIDETNSILYSAGKNGIIDSWTFSGDSIRSFGKAVYSINCIDVIENEQLLIAGDGAGYIYIWDIKSGELLNDLKVHSAGISDLFFKENNIYSSSFEGSISKTKFNRKQNILSTASLFSSTKMEIYDLIECQENKAIFSYLTANKKEIVLNIATIDLAKGNLLASTKAPLTIDKYDSRIYMTSLGLKPYGANTNIFTLYNSNTVYSISKKGEIKVSDNEKFTHDNTPLSLENYYNPEVEDGFALSPNEQFAYFEDEGGYGGLFNLSDTSEYGTFLDIRFEGVQNEKKYSENLKHIYPKSLLKELEVFSTQKETETGDVTSIVQSRFIYYQDRIYNQDSTLIATSNESNFIKIYDIQKKKLLVNLVCEEMAMRIIRHPTMPIFASLHIDGTINVWSFENFHLIKSFHLLNKKKARKVIVKKGYYESAENMPLLQMHRYFDNNVNDNPLDFNFSPLGDEIWVIMPSSIYNQTKALKFNTVNLINDEQKFIKSLSNWNSEGQGLPLEVKGDWNLVQMKYWDDFELYYSRFNTKEKSDQKIDSILGVATNEMITVVPNMFQSNSGKHLLLDYGDNISSIQLKDLSVNSVALEELPHKYRDYTSRIEFEKRDIYVSSTEGKSIFMVKRYIDTAYAYTKEVAGGYGIQKIDAINLEDLHGRNKLSYDQDEDYSAYYSNDYYLWDLTTQTILQINKKQHDSIYNSSSFPIDYSECEVIEERNWNDFMNETTAMEAEQMASRYYNSIRGYSDFDASTSSISWECEASAVIIGNKQIGIFEPADAEKTSKVIGPQSSAVVDQEFLMNSDYFITNNLNGEIIIWDWKNKETDEAVLKFIGSGPDLFAITADNYYIALSE
jgi:WD40 repeat protein